MSPVIPPVLKHKPWSPLDSSCSCLFCWFFNRSRSHQIQLKCTLFPPPPLLPPGLSCLWVAWGQPHQPPEWPLNFYSCSSIIHSSNAYQTNLSVYKIPLFLSLIHSLATHCTVSEKNTKIPHLAYHGPYIILPLQPDLIPTSPFLSTLPLFRSSEKLILTSGPWSLPFHLTGMFSQNLTCPGLPHRSHLWSNTYISVFSNYLSPALTA